MNAKTMSLFAFVSGWPWVKENYLFEMVVHYQKERRLSQCRVLVCVSYYISVYTYSIQSIPLSARRTNPPLNHPMLPPWWPEVCQPVSWWPQTEEVVSLFPPVCLKFVHPWTEILWWQFSYRLGKIDLCQETSDCAE